MFHTLLASRRSSSRRSPASVLAVVLHVAIVVAAASATTSVPSMRPSVTAHPLPIFAPKRVATLEPAAAASTSIAAAPALPAMPLAADVPPAIPASAVAPVTAGADLRALTGSSQMPGRFTNSSDASGSALADAALASDLVDDPVVVLSQRPPRYPPALEVAGITGSVRLAFVVDTAGRVEPASLRVVEATAPGFESAAREALLATRFRPARARGRPVRQLAEQWVRFAAR